MLAREMAADIRANAAKGVLPSAFDRLYAAADVHAASGKVKVNAADVERALGSVAGFLAHFGGPWFLRSSTRKLLPRM